MKFEALHHFHICIYKVRGNAERQGSNAPDLLPRTFCV